MIAVIIEATGSSSGANARAPLRHQAGRAF
jgi:hypothetical protein